KPTAIPPEATNRFVITLLSKLSRRKPTRQASRQAVDLSGRAPSLSDLPSQRTGHTNGFDRTFAAPSARAARVTPASFQRSGIPGASGVSNTESAPWVRFPERHRILATREQQQQTRNQNC